jgi:hypothetical protein
MGINIPESASNTGRKTFALIVTNFIREVKKNSNIGNSPVQALFQKFFRQNLPFEKL